MSLGNIANAMIVPTVALQLGANGSFVYKVNPDQTVSAVNVQTGAVVGDNTVITSGALTVNEAVVTDGVDKLKDGAKISVAGTGHHQGADKLQVHMGRWTLAASKCSRWYTRNNSNSDTGQHQWQHRREQTNASGVVASQPSAQNAQ